jgi:hypothetical protein
MVVFIFVAVIVVMLINFNSVFIVVVFFCNRRYVGMVMVVSYIHNFDGIHCNDIFLLLLLLVLFLRMMKMLVVRTTLMIFATTGACGCVCEQRGKGFLGF